MKQKTTTALYIVLALLMLMDFYLIFNVGNPNSLLRYVFPSTDFDLAVTLVVSAGIAFLSFYVFRDRKEHPVADMLRKNRGHITELREEGKSDDEIAESFLSELEKTGKVSPRIRRTVLSVLKEME